MAEIKLNNKNNRSWDKGLDFDSMYRLFERDIMEIKEKIRKGIIYKKTLRVLPT